MTVVVVAGTEGVVAMTDRILSGFALATSILLLMVNCHAADQKPHFYLISITKQPQ
jgi:hypothetical protein